MLKTLQRWWLAPKTFTVALSLSPIYVGVGLYALQQEGWLYVALWLAMLAAWWLEASLTVCRRCRHYGTWHCAGQGMLVSKIFAKKPSGLPKWRIVAHLLADVVVFFSPLPFLWKTIGAYAFIAIAWLLFTGVAAFPTQGPSHSLPESTQQPFEA
jgi:hypothetical protein